jgi:DNA-binding IclR family transcriptional regulator
MKQVSLVETGGHATRTVERACAVLSAFSDGEPRLSLGELAARVGLPKATVHRLASSLVATGFMEHGEDGGYSLGMKLSELGALARANLDVVTACASAVDALAAATEETVLLATADWDALELTVVDARASRHTLSVVPAPGERMPMPPGALCKALLLGLPPAESDRLLERLALPALTSKSHTDRAQLSDEIAAARPLGYAIAEEEYVEGVSGVAVPVLFDHGRPRAAISIVGPSARMTERLHRIGRLALELTTALRPPRTPADRVAA